MVSRAALVLAGGKARRFQTIDKVWQDKALAELNGKPLLVHAVENVRDVVDEVVVCVNDEARKAKYSQVLKQHAHSEVKFAVDEQVSGISGPNVAIMTGLKAAKADFCFTLPCDMPFMNQQVAEYMFNQAEGFDVAVPMWPNGRLETLTMVLQRKNALEIAQTLCDLRRPRSDDFPRGASISLFVSPLNDIRAFDSKLKSFININSREDLSRLQTRRAQGSATENLKLNLGLVAVSDLQLMRRAAKLHREGNLSAAQDMFASCAANFEAADTFFWAGLSSESQGEALLELAQKQNESKAVTEFDFDGKEAYLRAANNYRIEAEKFDENLCCLLAERALADKAWCESWAMGKHSHVHRYPSKVAKS